MKSKRWSVLLLFALFSSITVLSQAGKPASSGTGAKAAGKCAIRETIRGDLDERLARFKRVPMPFNMDGLSARERKMAHRLLDATRLLDTIYWMQSDPEGYALLKRISGCNQALDEKLRRFLIINGSRYDLMDEHKPFAGSDVFQPGRALYPAGITRQEIEAYVARHPERKAAIYSPYTVIKRRGAELITVPYHVEYRQWLVPAAAALREAAALSPDKAFARFLRLRADALLSDDYYKSDLAWLDLENPKFDIIFAPYETYLDDVLGIKASYGAAVMVRNEAESARLAMFMKYVPQIQEALPLPPEDRPSLLGHKEPMEVMDTPFRGGDLRHGYQAVADNLPNDARIHQEKGSKKIFFKNFMDARVNYVVLPIGKLLMREDQASQASMDGYLAAVIMHEICHALGPAFARTAAGRVDIRQSLGPIFSGVEESKADMVGLFALNWLMEKGVFPRERAPEVYSSYLAGIFRTVRFGVAEAHGRAEMMEFNYLSEQGAVTRNGKTGRYELDYGRMPGAIASLARELLEIEASGDRNRAEQWFKKYDSMPSELRSALENSKEVPVDIDPVSARPDHAP